MATTRPIAHPAQGVDAQPLLDPARAAGHVLQDEADRHGDAGRKTAARQVVATEEQEGGQHADDGEHPAHDDGGNEQVFGDAVAFLAVRMVVVEGILDALLFRRFQAFGGRAEPQEQGEDGQRDDAQHGNLAQRVEAAEIDEDDVDDIGAAALAIGAVRGNSLKSSPGISRVITV